MTIKKITLFFTLIILLSCLSANYLASQDLNLDKKLTFKKISQRVSLSDNPSKVKLRLNTKTSGQYSSLSFKNNSPGEYISKRIDLTLTDPGKVTFSSVFIDKNIKKLKLA